MDASKLLVSTIIGAVAMFVSGFLIFGLLLPAIGMDPPVHDCITPEDQQSIIWPILSNLGWGFLVSYIFIKWAGISTFKTGFKAGATLGFILGLLFAIAFVSSLNNVYDNTMFPVAAIGFAIIMGLGGGAIGWNLGRGKE